MQNLFVRKVSHSSCIWNNVLVTFLFFSYLISFESRYLSLCGTGECCWVNAWLVSRWSFVSNLFRCQTIKLNFSEYYGFTRTAVWCWRHGAVPKDSNGQWLLWSHVLRAAVASSYPQDNSLSGVSVPSARHDVVIVPPVTSINTWLKLFSQGTL